MNAIVRATCPKCRTALRIPSQWVGQLVKCKSCGAVVRSTSPHGSGATQSAFPQPSAPASTFDFAQPAPAAYPIPLAPFPPGQPLPPAAYPNAVPPGSYSYAAAPVPVAVGTGDGFIPNPEPLVTTPPRYRQKRGSNKPVWIAVCLLLTAGLVAAGIYGANLLSGPSGQPQTPTDPVKLVEQLGHDDPAIRDNALKALREMGARAEAAIRSGAKSENESISRRCNELLVALAPTTPVGGSSGTVVRAGPYPRRLLFIHISKYMYLNPLTSGLGGIDRTKAAANQLAFQWRVPQDKDNNQVFILSDTAQPEPPMPLKNVVTGTYDRFFDSSRAQDRIVVYFGGHALEKDGKTYLAPVEGEPDDANTLIPLGDFYARLNECKALQKVVIWDVCRYNPARGHERPGSAPMTASLAKSLEAAPAGVEVVLTCQPEENALESDRIVFSNGAYAGSVFLESMKSLRTQMGPKTPTPADPIPISEWSQAVGKRVNDFIATGTGNAKQTVKVEGKPKADAIAYNPDEPPAKPFEMPVAPKSTSPQEITLLAKEFQVPPIKAELTDLNLAELVYPESIMKDYQADVPLEEVLKDREKYKLRVAVLDAFRAIREVWAGDPAGGGTGKLPEEIMAPITDAVKRDINKGLEFYAIGIAKLELSNIALDEVERLKAGETKRWQAHYEYARAVVKARLAYLNEYNKLMGDVRTETLPALEKGQDRYKLASSEKMKSKKDVTALADEAQEAYKKLIQDHNGTPWAIQAKREKNFSLGLVWRPTSSAKEPDAK